MGSEMLVIGIPSNDARIKGLSFFLFINTLL
jgi:hypothetical protein